MREVLTRRQLWRRQICKKDNNIDILLSLEQPPNLDAFGKKGMSSERFDARGSYGNISSEGNDDEKKDIPIVPKEDQRQPTKVVTFNCKVAVIQIPTIEVYERLGLAELIWFREWEYLEFKYEAVDELRKYMVNHKLLDSKLAIQHLYVNDVPESLADFNAAFEEENSRSLMSSPATSCDTINSENYI